MERWTRRREPATARRSRSRIGHPRAQQTVGLWSLGGDHHHPSLDALPISQHDARTLEPGDRRPQANGVSRQGTGQLGRDGTHAGAWHTGRSDVQHAENRVKASGGDLEPRVQLDARKQGSPEGLDHPV